MKWNMATLVLIISTVLSGCVGVQQPDDAPNSQVPPVQQQEAKTPPVTAATTAPAPQKPTVKPQWVYTSPVSLADLMAPVGRPELVLSFSGGGGTSILRLDAAGQTSGSPLQLPGSLSRTTPDFARFLAVSGTKVSVVDLSGNLLWTGEVADGKGRPGLHLLPDGSGLVMTLLTEVGEGVRTHVIDLTGKSLWKIDGPEAGEFAGASAEELFFWNDRSLWRIRPDGTGRKDLLNREQSVGSTRVSADGSTIVVVGESGGKIYDHQGKPVADLPGGQLDAVTSDGKRVLVDQKGTYVLFDRQGQAIWKVVVSPRAYTELAPDGSWFLTAVKSASKETLQATLYDASGKLVWESTAEIAPENRAASIKLAISTDMRLAFMAVGKQLFAWSLASQ